jgi:uncharacterized protein (TIGR00269 family)
MVANSKVDSDFVPCSSCKSRAIISLSYSGQRLCKKHFLHYFEKKVKRTIREYNMLEGVKHLGVAVSGGKDSLTMLYLLKQIAGPMKIRLTAILVDEGIKGYRKKTIEDASVLCKKLDVPLKIYSFKKEIGTDMDKIMKKKKDAREVSCTYCGVFRRWILNKAARELKCDRIAIGHNLDDVVQSFLMNMFRNEPFRLARFGPLSGIVDDEDFVVRIRPLYKIPEREIAVYAVLQGFRDDFFPCPYYEEAFRHLVRDFVNDLEARYPGTKFKLLNSYSTVREAMIEKFKHKKGEKVAKCIKCKEPSSGQICKRCLLVEGIGKP